MFSPQTVFECKITSAVITGIYMLGDNFSLSGRSFYPVEGYTAATPGEPETMFTLTTGEATRLAVFNFDNSAASEGAVALDRLDLHPESDVDCVELWAGATTTVSNGALSYSVPPQDVRVYKITRKTL